MQIQPYELIDAEAGRRKNPKTFDAPSRAVIATLKPGDLVKVGARFDPRMKLGDTEPTVRAAWDRRVGTSTADKIGAERFWVRLADVEKGAKGSRRFRGTVENDLIYRVHHGLDCGQDLTFEGRNILDWMRAENEEAQSEFMAAMAGGIMVPRDSG